VPIITCICKYVTTAYAYSLRNVTRPTAHVHDWHTRELFEQRNVDVTASIFICYIFELRHDTLLRLHGRINQPANNRCWIVRRSIKMYVYPNVTVHETTSLSTENQLVYLTFFSGKWYQILMIVRLLTDNGLVLNHPACDGASIIDGSWKRMFWSETIFHIHHNATNCAVSAAQYLL